MIAEPISELRGSSVMEEDQQHGGCRDEDSWQTGYPQPL